MKTLVLLLFTVAVLATGLLASTASASSVSGCYGIHTAYASPQGTGSSEGNVTVEGPGEGGSQVGCSH